MIEFTPWVYPTLSLITSMVGIAVTWGMLRATVETLRKEVDRLYVQIEAHTESFTAFREEVKVRLAVAESGHYTNGKRRSK